MGFLSSAIVQMDYFERAEISRRSNLHLEIVSRIRLDAPDETCTCAQSVRGITNELLQQYASSPSVVQHSTPTFLLATSSSEDLA